MATVEWQGERAFDRQIERMAGWKIEQDFGAQDCVLIPVTIRYPAGVASGFVEALSSSEVTVQLLLGMPSPGDECSMVMHLDEDIRIQARVLRVDTADACIDIEIVNILSGGEYLLSLLLSRRGV